jgi:hypothetical protein
MTATQSDVLQIALAVLLLIFCAYAGGRVHQWYRQSFERDLAFREGYQQASHTLFPLASRSMHGRVPSMAHPESRVPDQATRIRPRDPFDGR